MRSVHEGHNMSMRTIDPTGSEDDQDESQNEDESETDAPVPLAKKKRAVLEQRQWIDGIAVTARMKTYLFSFAGILMNAIEMLVFSIS